MCGVPRSGNFETDEVRHSAVQHTRRDRPPPTLPIESIHVASTSNRQWRVAVGVAGHEQVVALGVRRFAVEVDRDVGDEVLVVQLWFMVGQGPVDEVLDHERLRSVHVDRAVVVRRTHHLAVVTVHPAGISMQAVEDLGTIHESLKRLGRRTLVVHGSSLVGDLDAQSGRPSKRSSTATSSTGRRGAGVKVCPGRSRPTGSRHPCT